MEFNGGNTPLSIQQNASTHRTMKAWDSLQSTQTPLIAVIDSKRSCRIQPASSHVLPTEKRTIN